jgi:hypothetical protein
VLWACAGHSLWSSASCRIPTGACGPKSASLPICAPSIRAGPPFRVLHTGQKKDHPRGGPILIAGAGHSLWSSASCRIPTGACGPKSASLPICAPSIRAGPPFRVLHTGQKKDHPRGGPILIAGAGHSLWSSASCRIPTGACGPKSASLPICAPSIRAGPPFRVLRTGQKKDHPRGGPILIAGAGHSLWSSASCRFPTGASGTKPTSCRFALTVLAPCLRFESCYLDHKKRRSTQRYYGVLIAGTGLEPATSGL